MVLSEIIVRQATGQDVESIARVHVVAWQVAYRGHMPDGYLDGLDRNRRARIWSDSMRDPARLILVAVDARALIGFVLLNPSRDQDAPTHAGEIAALYVDPQFWRIGCGTLLLEAAAEAAGMRGYRDLSLWVLESNRAARSFYEARGFVHDGASKTDVRTGFPLQGVRYSRSLS